MSRPTRNAAPTRFGLADPLGRQLWICALMVVLFIGGAVALSRSVKSNETEDLYVVNKDRISFSSPPDWIDQGVLQQVAEVLFADEKTYDVRDRDVTQTIAKAIEGAENPWIKSVDRVVKYYPTKVLVDVQYRQPVAMVEVKGDFRGGAKWGMVPVDIDGVILPGDGNEFLVENAKYYPRINIGGAAPEATKKPGLPWGDDRVAESARIAAALGGVWSRLGFHRIVAAGSDEGRNIYELHTVEGGHLIWGSAPGAERPHENSAAQKVGMLVAMQQTQIAAGQIDLRTPAELSANTAPAAR
ncbi:cell division protein FtsQ/DivIB [Blastopirellula retiformator]|uniref:Cell division protein FtsQ n=1 Tax=Blastopirellula retiformator TaxID=2527970 RepID=A0A5C5V7E2_9BACT|nr:hypothetical protein [Blastopirellula retiformator]TWT34488.1 hypothetical protein Enr8_18970 [Blastopirellula retiformator]